MNKPDVPRQRFPSLEIADGQPGRRGHPQQGGSYMGLRAGPGATRLPAPGTVVGEHYLVEHELGRGEIGVVLAARDLRQGGGPVALKWLYADARGYRAPHARLLHEAGPAVEHTNVVRIHEVDEDGQYLVMDRLEGGSLAQQLSRVPLAIEEACALALGVLEGLAALHRAGLVHGDLKPAHIFLVDDARAGQRPVLLDFGLVKSRVRSSSQQGALLGALAYTAPEQHVGAPVDARTDLYALSLVLYELLTARHPLAHLLHLEQHGFAWAGVPRPPTQFRPELSPALARVISKGMQVDAAARFADADSMAAALRVALGERAAGAARERGWGRLVQLFGG